MRVAVIAAPNLGYANTGMLTVDLAAAGVLKRIAPDCTVSWYTIHPPDQGTAVHPYVNPSELPFQWRPLLERFEEACSHDLILLWGDFLQARYYFLQDAVSRLVATSAPAGASTEWALRQLYKHLLFADAPDSVLTRVIVFGSSILSNRQTDYMSDDYGAHVARLFRHCAGVWMRDPVSAAKVRHLRPQSASGCLGTDAAFLLRDEDLACLSTTPWLTAGPARDRIGLFFGTRTQAPFGFLGFLQEMSAQAGLELEWLPWFPVHEWLNDVPPRRWLNPAAAAFILASRSRLKRLMHRGPAYSAGDLLGALKQYRFIVTDTYHLCVNAWRSGTPAICFGDPDVTPRHLTLSDYKKQVLFDMYDAGDFYFTTASLRNRRARARCLENIHTVTQDGRIHQAVSARMHQHARETDGLLTEAVARVLRQ